MSSEAVPCRACPGRAWAALALAVAGVVAYVLLLDVAWQRSSGVLTFVALAAAQLLAVSALRGDRRARTLVPALFTGALALGFVWLFFIVARLPAPTTFEQLERAPDVELLGAAGTPVRLSEEAARGPLLLVFFRGHW